MHGVGLMADFLPMVLSSPSQKMLRTFESYVAKSEAVHLGEEGQEERRRQGETSARPQQEQRRRRSDWWPTERPPVKGT